MCQLLLIFVLRKVAPKYNVLIYYYRKVKLNDHLNAIMTRFILEGFVELFLSSLINMELLSQIDLLSTQFGDLLNFGISMVYFIYSVSLPLAIALVLNEKIDFLETRG